jgi:hypothetical protein
MINFNLYLIFTLIYIFYHAKHNNVKCENIWKYNLIAEIIDNKTILDITLITLDEEWEKNTQTTQNSLVPINNQSNTGQIFNYINNPYVNYTSSMLMIDNSTTENQILQNCYNYFINNNTETNLEISNCSIQYFNNHVDIFKNIIFISNINRTDTFIYNQKPVYLQGKQNYFLEPEILQNFLTFSPCFLNNCSDFFQNLTSITDGKELFYFSIFQNNNSKNILQLEEDFLLQSLIMLKMSSLENKFQKIEYYSEFATQMISNGSYYMLYVDTLPEEFQLIITLTSVYANITIQTDPIRPFSSEEYTNFNLNTFNASLILILSEFAISSLGLFMLFLIVKLKNIKE